MTTTVVEWVDIFTREKYCKIILDSLKFCQEHKGLNVHAYVIMSNHVHMIISSKVDNKLSDTIRDFKSYTARTILNYIEESSIESRKKCMLFVFSNYSKTNSEYQFWRKGNNPIELSSPKFINQKIDYIHLNPVRAGLVYEPDHYKYSSSRNYLNMENEFEVDLLVLMSDEGFIDMG